MTTVQITKDHPAHLVEGELFFDDLWLPDDLMPELVSQHWPLRAIHRLIDSVMESMYESTGNLMNFTHSMDIGGTEYSIRVIEKS